MKTIFTTSILILVLVAFTFSLYSGARGCNLIVDATLHHGPFEDYNEGLILFCEYPSGYSVQITASFHPVMPDCYKYFKQFDKGHKFEIEIVDLQRIRVEGYLMFIKKIESFQK